MKKAYISGPITGRPITEVKQSFGKAAIRLEEMGYIPVNPLDNGLSDNHTWAEHMRVDIKLLMECDAIYLLKGYRDSKGAMIEYDLVRILKYDIIEQIKE